MDDDLAALKAYGEEFTDVAGLAKKVSKNWLLHKKKVKADIAAEEADWNNGEYFNAGKEACTAIEILVPYKPSLDQVDCLGCYKDKLDVMAVPDWVAGFMFGFTGNNNLAEIEKCYKGGDDITNDITTAFNDIKSGEFLDGVKAIGDIILKLPDDLANCENMNDDIKSIEAWAEIFKHPVDLVHTLFYNLWNYGISTKANIVAEEHDWAAGNYFDAGKDASNAFGILLPFKPYEPSVEEEYGIDLEANGEFLN